MSWNIRVRKPNSIPMSDSSLRFLGLVLLVTAFGVVIFCLVTAATAPSPETVGSTLAKKYANLPPEAAIEPKVAYTGLGPGRLIYLKFKLPRQNLEPFLSTTCFQRLDKLTKENVPFDSHTGLSELHEWWTPTESNNAVGGTCPKDGFAFLISLFSNQEISTIYVLVGR